MVKKTIILLTLASVSSLSWAWDDGGGTSIGSATNPESLTKGSYTLTADKVFTINNNSQSVTKTGSGTTFGWSFTPESWGWGESGLYYAFSVPANYTVKLSGTFESFNMDSSGEFWSEAALYKASDLKTPVVGTGLNQVNNSTYAAALSAGGGTTEGMWAAGYDYYMYAADEASDGIWQALFGYSGNSQNLANADPSLGTGGQCVGAFADYLGTQPTSPTSFASLGYTWTDSLQRPMKDSTIDSPSDTVIANGDTTEFIVFLKGGAEGTGISSMEYSDVVITVIPEPMTLGLLIIGASAFGIARYKKNSNEIVISSRITKAHGLKNHGLLHYI